MSDLEPAVVIKNLYKSFKLPHEQHSGIKQFAIGLTKHNKGYEVQHVLDDVSFEIKKGEFFGIVGRNGSGKSTLLKILAGIYSPDKGLVQVNGSLTPFIELGVGFNPELTGRENVFMNGALLGFDRKEMEAMYDDIVDFAELQSFMDQKLKNYSSGMQVRLAFSIAIKSKSDVLLFDEVLAVGDTEFQTKCFNYFKEIKKDTGKTVILVSHDMTAVKKFCSRALVLHEGKVVHIGDPNEAAVIYQTINFPDQSDSLKGERQKVQINISNKTGDKKNVFENGDELELNVVWDESLEGVKNVGVAILSSDGTYIFGSNTIIDNVTIDSRKRHIKYSVNLNLGGGTYIAKAAVFGETGDDTIFFNDRGLTFYVEDKKTWGGLTHLKHNWNEEA